MEVKHSCRCCLRCPPDMDLTTPYTHLGKTEIYSDMLKDCFDIHITPLVVDLSCGICSACVGRLRDASDFKLQVQRCQAKLQATLKVDPEVKIELSDEGANADSVFDVLWKSKMAGEGDARNVLHEDPLVKSETLDDVTNDDLSETAVPGPVSELATTYHTGEKPYTCGECNESFRNKPLLRKHIQHAHLSSGPSFDSIQEQFAYDFCSSTFETKNELEEVKSEHGVTKFMCSECKYTTVNNKLWQAHIKYHTIPRLTRFNCSQCSYTTLDKANFFKHQMKHTDDKPFKCNNCDFKSDQKQHMKIHQIIHTDEKPHMCSDCGFKCRRKADLRRHQMSHTGEKPYSCKNCDYKCSTKTLLIRHEKIHTGTKNHKCSHCDYETIDKSHLNRHLRIHTGEKPFKCSFCNYTCREKAHLRYHLTLHTGERPHKCSDCGFMCTRKADLQTHRRIHTGEKPYKCNHCNYASRQKHVLLTHLKSKHASEKLNTKLGK